MISSIEIQGFRGIKEGKLDELTPLVVLVGPNGCGKSAVLDALLLGASPVPANAVHVIANQRLKMDGGARWLLYKADRQIKSKIHIRTEGREMTMPVRENENRIRGVERDERFVILEQSPDIVDKPHILFKVAPRDQKSYTNVGQIFDNGSGYDTNFSYILKGVESVGFIDLGHHRTSSRNQAPLHQLYSQTVQQGQRKLAYEIISDVVPKLSLIEILTEGDAPVIHLVYDDYAVPAALAGDGIHALLRLSLELASRPNGVVLLEEPEVHQHPGALRQSARAILAAIRRGIQVVLTTHSLDLIDFLLSETQNEEELNKISVRRLQLKNGCLKSSNLSGSEAALARAEIEDDLR